AILQVCIRSTSTWIPAPSSAEAEAASGGGLVRPQRVMKLLERRAQEAGDVHLADLHPRCNLGLGEIVEEPQSHDGALTRRQLPDRPLEGVAAKHAVEARLVDAQLAA